MRFNLSRALSVALFILVILCVLFVGWAFFRYVGKGGGLGFLLGGLENNVDLPNAVANFNATPGDGFVTLDWKEPVSGAKPTEYHIYRGGSEASQDYLAKTENITFADASVINGVDYFYSVTAFNKAGEGPFSEKIKATPTKSEKPIVPPPTPTQRVPYGINDLAAVPAANFVSLAWSAPYNGGSSVTKYRIYRSVAPGAYLDANFIREIDAPTPPATSYIDYLVTSGVTYYYRVSAANSIGEGPRAKEASVTVGQQYSLPPQATGLIATPSYTSVSLSWTTPFVTGTPITSYRIYRSTVPGANSFLTSTNNNYYTDSGLASGAVYYYRVSAVSGASEGPRSMEVPARTTDYYYPPVYPPINYTYPGQPQLYASAGDSVAYLSWYAPSNGGTSINSYRIYQINYYGGESLLVDWPVISGNSYTVTGLTNNQTYYFRISAVNSVGEGAKSSSMSVTPYRNHDYPRAPSAMTDLRANINANGTAIVLSWSYPDDGASPITYYEVYRRKNSEAERYLKRITWDWTSGSDEAIAPGNTYYYRVIAVNNVGQSNFSNQATVTIAAREVLPTAPTFLAASIISTLAGIDYVRLQWKSSSAADSFKIYRGATASNLNYLGASNSLSYTDTTVIKGSGYYYQVSAVNSVGESGRSNTVHVHIPPEYREPYTPPAIESYVRLITRPTEWNKNVSLSLRWEASNNYVACRVWLEGYDTKLDPDTSYPPMLSATFSADSNAIPGTRKTYAVRCFKEEEKWHLNDVNKLDYWDPKGIYPDRPNYEAWGTVASGTLMVTK